MEAEAQTTLRPWDAIARPPMLLQSCLAKKMRAYKINTRVNLPKNNDAAVIEPATA
jgi:hypothetical protein